MFNVFIHITNAILHFVEEVHVNICAQMCISYDTFVSSFQGLWLYYLLLWIILLCNFIYLFSNCFGKFVLHPSSVTIGVLNEILLIMQKPPTITLSKLLCASSLNVCLYMDKFEWNTTLHSLICYNLNENARSFFFPICF